MEEEEGRSGVPFLLSSPHEEEEEEEEEEADLREHIASDITQKRWIELPSHRKGGIILAAFVRQGPQQRFSNDRRCRGEGPDYTWHALRHWWSPLVVEKVEQLKKEIPNVYVLDQFTNTANPEAHFRGTGRKVDIFVCGSGSGGSVTGAGKYLKMKNPSIKVICVEPAESPVISGGVLGRHKIQGLGPGFVPQNLEKLQIDEIVMVTSEESMTNARRLAREEGLLVGISSGANLAACLKVAAREENKGQMIVTMFASGG